MAEDQDESQKTEEPTEKKLEDARKKGQVASSKEINSFLLLFTATILIWVAAPYLGGTLTTDLRSLIERPHDLAHGSVAEVGQLMHEVLMMTLFVLLLPLAAFLIAALVSSVAQTGLIVAIEPMLPKLSKISPMEGFKRLFSGKSLVEFLKGIIKITLVGALATAVVWPIIDQFETMIAMDFASLVDLLHELMLLMMMAVVSLTAVIAGADFLYQRFSHRNKMRMSKQELKEEFKQTEGDPHIKGRLKQLRAEKSRRRMMAAVPTADVVITNPTHFAVALSYDADRHAAPIVVAKGADLVALRIRRLAEEHNISVIEDPPLARALHGAVGLDEQIPTEYFRAVAEIISVVFRDRGRPLPGR